MNSISWKLNILVRCFYLRSFSHPSLHHHIAFLSYLFLQFFTMILSGKISTELPVHSTADKWFHTLTNRLHHIQHVAGKVHGAKLHEGDDWHANDSVKHWTFTLGN